MEDHEVKEKAEFNMAVSYLNRLNSLFYAADEAAIHLDVYSWLHVLIAIYREISTEITEDQQEKYNLEIQELNNLIMKEISNFQRTQKMIITPSVYMKMHNFELGMRKIMKDSGLQMKSQSDASKALFDS